MSKECDQKGFKGAVEMTRKRKVAKEETERREKSIKSGQRKMELYEKAMSGDCDAIMACMYERGMIGKEELEDYHKIKEKYGNQEEDIEESGGHFLPGSSGF